MKIKKEAESAPFSVLAAKQDPKVSNLAKRVAPRPPHIITNQKRNSFVSSHASHYSPMVVIAEDNESATESTESRSKKSRRTNWNCQQDAAGKQKVRK